MLLKLRHYLFNAKFASLALKISIYTEYSYTQLLYKSISLINGSKKKKIYNYLCHYTVICTCPILSYLVMNQFI